jgi:hypothetical protein
MTEYTDVPTANALHQESQQVAQALANLEAGGSLGSMMIAPPPPPPPDPSQPLAPMQMAVHVTVPPPTDPALVAQITTWLNNRLTELGQQMADLGVTVPPASDLLRAPAPPNMQPGGRA